MSEQELREPVRVVAHLGGGYTRVLLENTVGVGLADGGIHWEIPTDVIPPPLRRIGARFIAVHVRDTSPDADPRTAAGTVRVELLDT